MRDLCRHLERELAAERAEHEETTSGARMLADAYSAERALADRLADALENSVSWRYAKPAFDAWREARRGTV